MSLELTGTDSYEVEHPSGARFRLRHWTMDMQDEVDRQCIQQDGKGGFTYSVPKERELKISLALEGWSGVLENGTEVPCTPETKKKLPVGAVLWLIREIDGRAGIRMLESEKKN